mgnify:CR=1 FL=1
MEKSGWKFGVISPEIGKRGKGGISEETVGGFWGKKGRFGEKNGKKRGKETKMGKNGRNRGKLLKMGGNGPKWGVFFSPRMGMKRSAAIAPRSCSFPPS